MSDKIMLCIENLLDQIKNLKNEHAVYDYKIISISNKSANELYKYILLHKQKNKDFTELEKLVFDIAIYYELPKDIVFPICNAIIILADLMEMPRPAKIVNYISENIIPDDLLSSQIW